MCCFALWNMVWKENHILPECVAICEYVRGPCQGLFGSGTQRDLQNQKLPFKSKRGLFPFDSLFSICCRLRTIMNNIIRTGVISAGAAPTCIICSLILPITYPRWDVFIFRVVQTFFLSPQSSMFLRPCCSWSWWEELMWLVHPLVL